MSPHSVVEAKNKLSELDRALDGEVVIITRHGKPVVERSRSSAAAEDYACGYRMAGQAQSPTQDWA